MSDLHLSNFFKDEPKFRPRRKVERRTARCAPPPPRRGAVIPVPQDAALRPTGPCRAAAM